MTNRRRAPASGLGDINMDGWVDFADAALLGKIIQGTIVPTPEMRRRADINGDGVIDERDLRLLHGYLAYKTDLKTPRPRKLQTEPPLELKIWAAKNYGENNAITANTSDNIGIACLTDNLATLPTGYTSADVCNEDFLLWCQNNVGWTVPKATVNFETTPSGAEIWINGIKRTEVTPATIELDEGSYDIVFKKSGYVDCNCSRHTGGCPTTVVAGETYTISCALIPLQVSITATSPIPLKYCDESGCFDIPCTRPNPCGIPISITDGRFPDEAEATFLNLNIDVTDERTGTIDYNGFKGSYVVNLGNGTIQITLTEYPKAICHYINLVNKQNLTKTHALYVYYKSQGWNTIAQQKYNELGIYGKVPIADEAATRDNALGIYYYSQGWNDLGNSKTGCGFTLGLGKQKKKSKIRVI